MARTPRVKFFLEKRKDSKTGKVITTNVPARFSLSYGGRYMSSTGIRIDEKNWDEKKGRVKPSHTHAGQYNKILSDLKKELEDLCLDAWVKNIRITTDYISSNLKKNQHSENGLMDWLDEYIEQGKKKWQNSTVKKFTTIKNHLKELSEKKHVKVEFDELNATFFEKLVDFYFEERKFRNTTVRKDIRFIQQFLSWSTKKGYNKNLDFKEWKLETGTKKEDASENVISLTIVEFLQIYNKELTSISMQRARDYLTFACFTGLRYSDIANLKKSDIDYKQGIINCTTIKTGAKTLIPFNDYSREVLEKYAMLPNYNSKGLEMAFPVTSNQKMNKALKELAKFAEINDLVSLVHYKRNQRVDEVKAKHELISTHIGRRTFITFAVWLGIESEITMGITTHKSHAMMEKYYTVNTEMKQDAMSKFSKENLQSHLSKVAN
jgi:integrase